MSNSHTQHNGKSMTRIATQHKLQQVVTRNTIAQHTIAQHRRAQHIRHLPWSSYLLPWPLPFLSPSPAFSRLRQSTIALLLYTSPFSPSPYLLPFSHPFSRLLSPSAGHDRPAPLHVPLLLPYPSAPPFCSPSLGLRLLVAKYRARSPCSSTRLRCPNSFGISSLSSFLPHQSQ